jgi:hypothetical protein
VGEEQEHPDKDNSMHLSSPLIEEARSTKFWFLGGVVLGLENFDLRPVRIG